MTTVKTDVAAISPTANAKAVAQGKGVDLPGLMTLLQQYAIEMQALVKQIIAKLKHPDSDSGLRAVPHRDAQSMRRGVA
jgi:hypothetical protein